MYYDRTMNRAIIGKHLGFWKWFLRRDNVMKETFNLLLSRGENIFKKMTFKQRVYEIELERINQCFKKVPALKITMFYSNKITFNLN